ncbi:DgyrCDS5486 [Dimorphilus gyrociliatus]|uniref:DgyrCDS5486 n=1 Tax=Dimorphilus gyrociliatus TaxID=2664684 RepID=A0A7I8VMB8_9ANNE|nr:DgyrCDS5486 [Dimorphilus gyrociliatus]
MFSDVDNPVEKLNSSLPPEIRVLAMRRVTKGFNCKNNCDSRTYTYLIPTHAFSPKDDDLKPSQYRIDTASREKVDECLSKFVGVHNFHNFTSGKKFRDPSAKRNILSFKMEEPFVREEMEFAELRVKGQSFMMHHIRKMIGLTIAIVKGYTTVDLIDKCWQAGKVDVPKAPGLGLWLETLHYDMYNKRFAKSHDSLDWADFQEDIANFKKNYIYPTIIECEAKERPNISLTHFSMIDWLNTLSIHHYDEIIRDAPEKETEKIDENNTDRDENETIKDNDIEKIDENIEIATTE